MSKKYIIDKALNKQIQMLYKRGGHYQRAAEQLAAVVGKIKLENVDPFISLNLTKHGETRIKNCLKYDLSGFCRLITIQYNGIVILKFVGDHDECDKWLNNNKGLSLGVDGDSGVIKDVFISDNIQNPEKRIDNIPDFSEGFLFTKLGDYYFDKITEGVPRSALRILESYDSTFDEDELIELSLKVEEKEKQELIFDVFMSLRAGNVDSAKNRILQYLDEIKLLEKSESENIDILSNDQYLNFDDIDGEDLKILMENKHWYDWMLFMHPAQKRVVDAEFSGSARLLGVSGSGKTCVIVRRAVKLAKKYPDGNILVLTLNRSLASLIQDLVNILIEAREDEELKSRIKVISFWELCRDLILEFGQHEFGNRILEDFTDRHQESIQQIWKEWYCSENNNDDAKELFPIHKSLLSRSIFPQDYIKQEFDWIRSAYSPKERRHYFEVEREGRTIPLALDQRKLILKSLNLWEQHLPEVGVTDYLALSQIVADYLDKINPRYKCVLVDEVQDFGTLELKIIRKLAEKGENDLFLCGDIAQVVHTKHHKITQAGVQILPEGYLTIKKNYRNSREILQAAYSVFKNNTKEESYKVDGFEVLNPEYANFSSPKPFLRQTSTLNNGFNFAIAYLKQQLDETKGEKGCIALCGFSFYDVLKIGQESGFPILDGKNDLKSSNIFISDLEQTKGFEFDRMIILNCNDGVIPNPEYPQEEWFRDISKFYVAMTRAKKELIISYNEIISGLFKDCLEHFTMDKWRDHLSVDDIPEFNIDGSDASPLNTSKIALMTGREFLYGKEVIGISNELQDKLTSLVSGTTILDQNNRYLEFKNMGTLKKELNSSNADIPTLSRLFGQKTFRELRKLLGEKPVQKAVYH